MEVSYSEGLAIHTGPESCASGREATGEALTGDCIGQPLSRERIQSRMPTPFTEWKATFPRAIASGEIGPAWSQTLACAYAPCAGTGRSRIRPVSLWLHRSASGR